MESIDRARFGEAFNWGMLTLSLADKEAISNPDFQDSFRPSRVAGHLLAGLARLLWRLYESFDVIVPSSVASGRLRSWAFYSELYQKTRPDESNMLRRLKQKLHYSLHSAVILADEAFRGFVLGDHTLAEAESEKLPFKQTFDQLRKEDVASGASYALESYNRVYGISPNNFTHFANSSPEPKRFEATVLLACRLRELLDLEASVFRLGYTCQRLAGGRYAISPPTDRFGMAMTFGYIRYGWGLYRFSKESEPAALSFRDMCAEWVKSFGTDTVQFVETKGLTRLRIEIPGVAAKMFGEKILLVDKLFREEVIELRTTCYDLLTDYNTLAGLRIGDSLTIGDVIKIFRIFRFFAYVRAQKLSALGHEQDILRWNSILGGMEINSLITLMNVFGVPESHAKEYLNLFAWDTSPKSTFLDLQYTPLIRMGIWLAVPFSIHACFNLVRSAFLTAEKRLYSSGEVDPLANMLAAALSTVTNDVKKGVGYSFEGISGDFDCIAKLGRRVYIFECKNTLHPCSSFEQRTMIDHIQKAATQLDRAASLWKRIEFREYVQAVLGWDLASADDLRTCIVLSTRLLSGVSFGGHPIRQGHELANFVVTGEAELIMGDIRKRYRMWRGEHFSSDELDTYLSDNENPVFEPIWNAFVAQDFSWEFEKVVLVQKAYGFDNEEYFKSLETRGQRTILLTKR